jgi:signal transduction histidine kinase
MTAAETRGETAVHESAAQWPGLPDQAKALLVRMPAFLISRRGRILRANEAALAFLGMPIESVAGRTFAKAGIRLLDEHGRAFSASRLPWAQTLRARLVTTDTLVGFAHHASAHKWAECTCMPIRETPRSPWSAVVVLSDVTRHRQPQDHLMQVHKMETLGALAGGVVHDFNNILTSIRTIVQGLLLDKNRQAADMDAMADIEKEAIRGAELTQHILRFCRPADRPAKRSNLERELTALRGLLQRTLPRSIRVTINLPDPGLSVRIEPTHLEQILLNLILNARDAIRGDGAIVVTASAVTVGPDRKGPAPEMKPGLHAQIDVSDTGCGIPTEIQRHMFEPFITTKANGTGLGLPIVQAMLRRAGGRIIVNSLPKQGTTFSVFLPACRSSRVAARVAARAGTAPAAQPQTLMVVDDETILMRSVARFLEKSGYRVLTACNGELALDTFMTDKASLVLMDYDMPDMTGLACARKMWALAPDLRIILLSGHFINVEACPEGRFSAMVQKPFDSHDLLAVIRRVLRS